MEKLELTKKYEQYPEYKDSGVEWLGMIPKNWKHKKLKSFFSLSNERVADSPEVTTILSVSGYRGVEIRKNIETFDGQMPSENVEAYRVVRKNQLVVNTMWLNFTGLGVSNYEGYVSPAYRSYNISKEMVPEYVNHLMRSVAYVQKYSSLLYGMRPNSLQVKPYDFEKIEILFPEINEQERLSSYLDEKTAFIDQIIEKKQKQIELLREKRTAVINHAVTKGLDPKAELVDSGIDWIGKIPKGWEVKKLGQVAKIETGGTPPKNDSGNYSTDGLVWVKPDNLQDFIPITDSKEKLSSVGAKMVPIIPCGAVLVNCIGDVGKIGVAGTELSTNQQINSVIFKRFVIPDFGKYMLYAAKESTQNASNSVVVAILNKSKQSSLRFAIPPIKVQENVAQYLNGKVEHYDKAMKHVEQSIALLQEFKSSLISHVVTGKVKV